MLGHDMDAELSLAMAQRSQQRKRSPFHQAVAGMANDVPRPAG